MVIMPCHLIVLRKIINVHMMTIKGLTQVVGAYCPVPHIDKEVLNLTNEIIAQPIAQAMYKEGYEFLASFILV